MKKLHPFWCAIIMALVFVLTGCARPASRFGSANGSVTIGTATVGNVTISGDTGTPISPATVVITLSDDKFTGIYQGTSVTGWFTNIPTGLQANAAAPAEGAPTVTITVSGTTTGTSVQALAITIPGDYLDDGSAITVATNPNAKYDIFAIISSLADFEAFATTVNNGDWGRCGRLAGSGTLIDIPNNASYIPIADIKTVSYQGIFDGNGGTIKINITGGSHSFLGLFGVNNGTIQNLTVTGNVGANTSGNIDYVAGVVAYNDIHGLIQRVVSKVTVNIEDVAYNTVYNIGGIVGFNGWDKYNSDSPHYTDPDLFQPGGVIYQCRNEGEVNGGFNKTGGIAGENAWRITECVNTGVITCAKSTNGWPGIGGIAGRNGNNNNPTEQGQILHCYNLGEIRDETTRSSSHDGYGGITGWCNSDSTVIGCYTTGQFTQTSSPVSGSKNPIIGQADQTSGRGIPNFSLNSIYAGSTDPILIGIRKTEAEMKDQNFVYLLNAGNPGLFVYNSGGYPKLSWE